MPFVDRVIQLMRSQGGVALALENDQPCVVETPAGPTTPTKDRLNYSQILNMVSEVLPDPLRMAFASGETCKFAYGSGAEQLEIEVDQVDAGIRVRIAPPGSAAPARIAAPEAEAALSTVSGGASTPDPTAAERPLLKATPADGKRVEHLDELFRLLHAMDGSDLHLNAKARPIIRLHGNLKTLDEYEILSADRLHELIWAITPERNRDEWDDSHDSDYAYELPGVARFRCNIFMTRHGVGGNYRLIPTVIRSAEEMQLTQAMLNLCFLSKGLVLVTGPTGCGKTTTLAALLDHCNRHRTDHIVTIEDPIEFVHPNIHCLINQRQVHVHTNSFARALRAALREDPDIVLVGEMRDLETVAIAIETAETGHLVFGTLHTTTAASTVDRIIDQFPPDQQEQIRVMLSESLKAVIAQTLCRTVDGRRVAAFEILLIDPAAANLIREGKTYQLTSMMQIGKNRGCITMNDSLFAHVKAGRVDPKQAYLKAVDKVGLLSIYEKEGITFDAASMAA